ncbi:MAG: 50S ribosomal protein L29 [Thermaerobacter sp.]|nr:50S ribosomal protein L29 [Thermaerobacter sp.]
MKRNEIARLSGDEIDKKVKDLKGELFNLRFQAATGQLENPMRIREVRRSIAQLKTVQHLRELGMEA